MSVSSAVTKKVRQPEDIEKEFSVGRGTLCTQKPASNYSKYTWARCQPFIPPPTGTKSVGAVRSFRGKGCYNTRHTTAWQTVLLPVTSHGIWMEMRAEAQLQECFLAVDSTVSQTIQTQYTCRQTTRFLQLKCVCLDIQTKLFLHALPLFLSSNKQDTGSLWNLWHRTDLHEEVQPYYSQLPPFSCTRVQTTIQR